MALIQFGLTAEEVAGIVNKQVTAVDGLTKAYDTYVKASTKPAKAELTAEQKAAITQGVSAESLASWSTKPGGGQFTAAEMAAYGVAPNTGALGQTLVASMIAGGLTQAPYTLAAGTGSGASVATYGSEYASVTGYATGGIVTQPTMALVGEAGPEAIIPLNEAGAMGGITINFTQPVFFDREDTMNKFVDMISKGIDRKQRLRFGGAYSG